MSIAVAPLSGFGVTLDPITEADLEMVLAWRNHPDVRTQMFTDREITCDEHRRWFAQLEKSDSAICVVARWRGEPVAVLTLRTLDGGPLGDAQEAEPGLYLVPDSPVGGTLFAFAPIVLLHDHYFSDRPDGRLHASVRPTNERALRFNRRLGYVESAPDAAVVRMELTGAAHSRATEPIRRILSRAETTATVATTGETPS